MREFARSVADEVFTGLIVGLATLSVGLFLEVLIRAT